ncbi:ATP-binding protein [Nanoarchaeota archaeon]
MSKENELKTLIIENFGQAALQLPDIYEKGWTFPLAEDNLEEAAEILVDFAKSDVVDELPPLVHRISRTFEDLKESYTGRDNVYFASGMFGHELGNILGIIVPSAYNIIKGGKPFLDEPGRIDKFLASLTTDRVISLGICYLASSGDEQFLAKVPLTQLQYVFMLYAFEPSGRKTAKVFPTPSEDIFSPEYLALYHIARNAPTDYDIRAEEDGDNLKISLQDYGKGILDKNEKPLPPERFHEIFGEFSTTGGGLGLQIAKALIDLRGGYIEVITKTKDNPAFAYRTDTKQDYLYTGPLQPKITSTGTIFVLNVPKEIT